jgi:hypothetical protein
MGDRSVDVYPIPWASLPPWSRLVVPSEESRCSQGTTRYLRQGDISG